MIWLALKDLLDQVETMSASGKLRTLFSFKQWRNHVRWARQRVSRGWSDRDTWSGGDYIVEVSAGILRHLNSEKGHIDWVAYMAANYGDSFGYKDLNDVADDLELYLDWQVIRTSMRLEQGFSFEDILAIDVQVHSQATDAMRFIAENFASIWD